MFILARAITYATLFIGLVLVFIPSRVLSASGIVRPALLGPLEIVGLLVAAAGGVLAVSCVLAFAFLGRGTPAPFDPPRRLVVVGPYRLVRNPMYVGAGSALAGAALCFRSPSLLGYVAAFFLVTHVFVVAYEEPTLRRMFGKDYATYCDTVGRWWPRRRRGNSNRET
jgi:protein-S-isoprenylcysteine O-methyltransferase Ste14